MVESVPVQLAFIGGLGPTELFVIFLIVLLVFGAKRIPEIAQGLGKGITEFKRAARDITDEFDVDENSSQNSRNELKSKPSANTTRQTSRQSQSQSNDTKQA